MKAILRPSGDQRAHLSCAPEERVRLRVTPFSIGALKTSPRATNTARSPFGERAASSIWSLAATWDGRVSRPSPGTSIARCRDWPVRVSKTFSSPFIS